MEEKYLVLFEELRQFIDLGERSPLECHLQMIQGNLFHYIAASTNYELVLKFVQAGYPLINDEEGKNPLFYAVENNNDIRIIELLAGMLVNNKPAAAAIDNYRMTPLFFCKTIDAAKILLAHDCDPNVVNIDGCTALHFMAKNSLELIEFILAITPDNLIVRDTDGDTLISLMIEDNRVDDVIYLLKKKYPYTSELLEYYQSITEDKQLLSFLQTC